MMKHTTKTILLACLLASMLISCGAKDQTVNNQTTPSSGNVPDSPTQTTLDHANCTTQNPTESEPATDDFDYTTLNLPNYAAENPKRYLDQDERFGATNGWQNFGKTGEIRTMPMPMAGTYTYQMYSYYIRNDLSHLYPHDTPPTDLDALAVWLTDTTADGRRALWYSMGQTMPNEITIVSSEEFLPTNGEKPLRKVIYTVNEGETTRNWAVYLLCEDDGTLSAYCIRPNEMPDTVFSFTDSIAKSYQKRS